jgi:hypothetical protein
MALKLRSSIAINSSAKLIKKRDFPGIGAQLLNVRSLGGGIENSHFSQKTTPF